MGGNALKHLSPVRLTSSEVIDLVQHLHRNWQLVDPRPFYVVPWRESPKSRTTATST